jgi:tRNA 2-thiouridine synthesizing protein A
MQVNNVLDCVGLYCPMPIIQTKKEMDGMEPGQVLEIVADDKGIVSDMPAWCESTGNECLEIKEADGEYHVYVRKS